MTEQQRPRIAPQITYGSIISTIAVVISALGILVAIARFAALLEADIRAIRQETALMIATEREHRLALERRVDREQGEQERRLEQGLGEVKQLLRELTGRVDRVLERDRRTEIGPNLMPGGAR